jgi:hypothetical protein
MHAPFMQLSPPGQRLPQAPQFVGSAIVLVQWPSHIWAGSGQVIPPSPDAGALQMPCMQTSPEGQTFPQPPQFIGSRSMRTHMPLHISCDIGHVPPSALEPPVQMPSSHD